jgi:DNA-binding response OmpR family regulator
MTSAGPGPVAESAADRLALVVDDEEGVRAMLVEILSRAGFSCLEAGSAEEALTLLDTRSPQLGVLDIALPGLSGAELAWKIRRRLPGLPLVALSGRLSEWDADDLRDLGFDRVFGKPMDVDEFLGFCERACTARPDA